jgi:hypothetical protein
LKQSHSMGGGGQQSIAVYQILTQSLIRTMKS